MLRLAFSSNAFKKTDLITAARQIAAAGYRGIEVMADVPHAYPPAFGPSERASFKTLLRELGLQVSNVNAFTLFAQGDTYHPTWIEKDPTQRRLRIEHTLQTVRLAADLGSKTVSLQPGGPTIGIALTREQTLDRFAQGLEAVLPTARDLGITLAIEPEPGLLIQDAPEYVAFKQQFFAEEKYVGMNCDVGHLFCVGNDPADVIRRYPGHLAHVHLEDISKSRVHQHLPLGQGAMDIPAILTSLQEVHYAGWVTVELYPYVTTAQEVAQQAMKYLRSTGLA